MLCMKYDVVTCCVSVSECVCLSVSVCVCALQIVVHVTQ